MFYAILGGVVFNLANLLVGAAIDLAGMAVAFPVGIGLALVLGVVTNYVAQPDGNPVLLTIGVFCVVMAMVLNAWAYKSKGDGPVSVKKGLLLAIAGGTLMAFFYRFVAASLSANLELLEQGKLMSYSAVFLFSLGILVSNFVWNTFFYEIPI